MLLKTSLLKDPFWRTLPTCFLPQLKMLSLMEKRNSALCCRVSLYIQQLAQIAACFHLCGILEEWARCTQRTSVPSVYVGYTAAEHSAGVAVMWHRLCAFISTTLHGWTNSGRPGMLCFLQKHCRSGLPMRHLHFFKFS